MTSQHGKQTIAIHILSNKMKSGQLIEYIMRNILLEKQTRCGGETIPRLFSKLSISLDQPKVLYILF